MQVWMKDRKLLKQIRSRNSLACQSTLTRLTRA